MEDLKDALNHLHLEDLDNSEHPSMFDEAEGYEVLILRLYKLVEEELVLFSYPFVLSKNEVYYYSRDTKEFREFSSDYLTLYKFIDKRVDEVMRVLNIYIKDIDKLEEALYERKTREFMDEWFWIKKDLIRMNRLLNQAIKVMDEFMQFNEEREESLHIAFSDVSEHLNRTSRGISTNLEKLDTLYSFFTSITNEKLNKNIYMLTILSAIFLPLNLLVGFFGMNTEGMIFSGNPHGTLIVLTTLIVITLFSFIFFFRKFKS